MSKFLKFSTAEFADVAKPSLYDAVVSIDASDLAETIRPWR